MGVMVVVIVDTVADPAPAVVVWVMTLLPIRIQTMKTLRPLMMGVVVMVICQKVGPPTIIIPITVV